MQAVHQVGNDEVPELQQLLRHGRGQEARQERQAPEERARLDGVQEIPPGEHVPGDEEEGRQLVPLEKPLPHVEGEVPVIRQEVLVDGGELPHQEQADARREDEKQRPPFHGLQEAKSAVVTQRDGEGEEEGEGQEIEELGEVEAGFVTRPVAHHDPVVQHHEHQEADAHHGVRPGHQQHRLHLAGGGEELQHEKRGFLHAAERQGNLGRRGLLVPLLGALQLPGLVHLGGHQSAGAEGHPDDVVLTEEHGADAEERRGLVAAVERHEIGEEGEESRPGVGVVKEVEEVEHGEGGERQRREDSPGGRLRLDEEGNVTSEEKTKTRSLVHNYLHLDVPSP